MTKTPLIPLSDGCGRVVATGPNVKRVQVGDRVCPTFFQTWLDGDLTEAMMPSALGGACDGLLAERVVLSEQGLITPPDHLTDAEAACLPCAAVTAWQALTLAGITAGHDILCLGTGGVSVFALQLARAHGARVIITSSSDEKLARAGEIGADVGINYQDRPEWHEAVREVTNGLGVDNVVEVGGAGTLDRSMNAARVSGTVSLIGVLTGNPKQNPSLATGLVQSVDCARNLCWQPRHVRGHESLSHRQSDSSRDRPCVSVRVRHGHPRRL